MGDFPPLFPQLLCTLSHQGPLCTSYHQVVSDGAAASRSQESGREVAGLEGEEERVHKRGQLECSQKRWGTRNIRRGRE